MSALAHSETVTLLLAVGLLLAAARLCGELMIKLQQPAVIGELFAGIILGPTLLGALAPDLQQALFPATGGFPVALDALTTIAIVLFLVVAGLEVDLSVVWRQGRAALLVATLGTTVPFALGFAAAWYIPWLSAESDEFSLAVFAVFFATALSISALPVIAKIMMDLGIFRSDLGMVVISGAIVNDIVGWMIFAVILGFLDLSHAPFSVPETLALLLVFTLLILTIGRRLIHVGLARIHAHFSWPGGVLGFVLAAAFFCAAFTEWIGIHGIFGAFLFGVAVGDSPQLRGRTRRVLEQFISYIFAPLFFASVGLKVDFAANFDLPLVLVVLALATLGKVAGCAVGARIAGMGKRESWGVGFAMNARGAMEIILALLTLEIGLIGEHMFVALVVMALVTSMTSGVALRYILAIRKPRRFFDFVPNKGFLPSLAATNRRDAIFELAASTASNPQTAQTFAYAAWDREQIMSTSLTGKIAVPHARVPGIKMPIVAIGLSKGGVDFEAPDAELCRIICLVLTPESNADIQLQILSDIALTLGNPDTVAKVLDTRNVTELMAVLRTRLPALH